jgi:hypothetical protein
VIFHVLHKPNGAGKLLMRDINFQIEVRPPRNGQCQRSPRLGLGDAARAVRCANVHHVMAAAHRC